MSWFNIEIPSLFKRDINGIDEIDEIDHALQEHAEADFRRRSLARKVGPYLGWK